MQNFDSEAAVRNYVEGQLERSIRAKRPELQVSFMDDFDRYPAAPKRFSWRITLPRPKGSWPADYRVEARLDEGEFLVWFGYSSSGAWATRHIMRPAVHVCFEDLGFAAREFPEQVREQFTLGEILEEMCSATGCITRMCLPSHEASLRGERLSP